MFSTKSNIMIGLTLALFSVISTVSAQCTVDGTQYICTDVSEVPESLDPLTDSLIIRDSPNLTNIALLPAGIVSLTLDNVGVTNFDGNAISGVSSTLKRLDIHFASKLQQLHLQKPQEPSAAALEEIKIRNCSLFSDIDGISQYINLQSITITSTGLKAISEYLFDGLGNVLFLDVSYNNYLSSIHENAFEDMHRLRTLNMNGCALRKLYGNYFNSAYESGSLQLVKALLNPYQCFEMCDFTTWYWKHTSFYEYSYIGSCTMVRYNNIYVYAVYDLNRYESGCPPLFWIIFGSILGVMVIMGIAACILVAVCQIDYKKYCCFWRGSRRNRRNSFPNGTTVNAEVDTYHFDFAGTHKTNVSMYEDTPPTYEELTVPQPTSGTSTNIPGGESQPTPSTI